MEFTKSPPYVHDRDYLGAVSVFSSVVGSADYPAGFLSRPKVDIIFQK